MHRACHGRNYCDMLRWFAALEGRIWIFAQNELRSKPEKIFLVLGQTMVANYWITYQESKDSHCELLLKGDVTIPDTVETKSFLGYGLEKAAPSPNSEFEIVNVDRSTVTPSLHSVFLEVFVSLPLDGVPSLGDTKLLDIRKMIGKSSNFLLSTDSQFLSNLKGQQNA